MKPQSRIFKLYRCNCTLFEKLLTTLEKGAFKNKSKLAHKARNIITKNKFYLFKLDTNFLLLIGCLALTGCGVSHFAQLGWAPYCRVDYRGQYRNCNFNTVEECQESLEARGGVCMSR